MNCQSCAACKHQRRKCSPDCVLARYFPAHRARQFLDIHRVFGISNLMKFYNAVAPELREHTVESMIHEAEMRREDPVYGCFGAIRDLTARINVARQELDDVRLQIAFHRQHEHTTWQQRQQMTSQLQSHVPSLPPMGDQGENPDVGMMSEGASETSRCLTHSTAGHMKSTVGNMKPFRQARSNNVIINSDHVDEDSLNSKDVEEST